jgi:TfoX/Sxy family transcriptional regulator of competence genes
MAYDEALAERVRACLAREGGGGITERAMFGGLGFMLNGNMAVGLRGDELMVRVGPDGVADALEHAHARQSYMGERLMKGFILVGPEGVESDDDLDGWVRRGVEFAHSLPPKS